ncbi:ABC transporter substrate-binding protein [Pseudobacteroides cellulosolvens]|uniref:ABC-type transporter, periplasmic subunit n=1 Tax=Pseudobacteroides cellulosolvens ATCC 35603 = DSM 2933 TaxID=398512 RepID=A0A0L6JI71_9FIRM|nr:ABC transporter substrate-binding protein [Pseudobacteroides cellulosolvens]KNY25172.1 ABC-type transporter, periplasmic subunit [Pseudobacteroides cellulosolvens ATCC 35603 = DSM 2933]
MNYLLKFFKFRKMAYGFMLAVFIAGGFTACGGKVDNMPQELNQNKTEYKAAGADSQSFETKSFTDTVGRTITVPVNIKKVYSLSPVGNIIMYSLAPDKIVGLSSKVEEDDKKFLSESYINLPVLSGNFGMNNKMNAEEILKVKPDVIINMGNVDHTSVDGSQKIQEQLGIPVAYIGFDIKSMDIAYKKLGELLGENDKAANLADYCKKVIEDTADTAAKIPEDKKVRVYYAEGEKGMQTDPKGSPHTEVIDLIGALNVADVKMQKGYGRSSVSMEQLLKWNPEIILVCADAGTTNEKNPYNYIMSDSTMKNLSAVKNKKVYQVPYHPFNWIDRPPSVNRIIGIKWLSKLLYPDYFKYDIKKEVKEFYDLFYHKKLTDDEVNYILNKAI